MDEKMKKLAAELEHRYYAAVGDWEDDVCLTIDEARSLVKYLKGENPRKEERPRVLGRNEIGKDGTGWLETWLEGDEHSKEYKALFRIAWAEGHSVEVDDEGCASFGCIVPDKGYNEKYGWRIWTGKPSEEERKFTPWVM